MAGYPEIVPIVLRWFHLVSGITWIGLLYFFNLVQAPVMKQWDATTRQRIVTTLTPRALWWFRWGAALTVSFGLLLLDAMARAAGGWWAFAARDSGRIILLGGGIGLVMFLNVWLIIWPNQKRVIEATRAALETGAPVPGAQAVWARRAFLASRTNFVLSMPMLVLMASSSHLADLRLALGLACIAAAGSLVWVWYMGRPAVAPAPNGAARPASDRK